jgi:hypothetical protein
MGVTGDLLLTLVGLLLALFAPLEVGLLVVFAFWLLVPGFLAVPISHFLLVDRVVLDAFALRLLLRSGHAGEPKPSAYALSSTHAGIAVVLVGFFFTGVAFAPQASSLSSNLHAWLLIVDLAVLYVVVLACARTIGVLRVASLVGIVACAVVAIGVIERITGFGWANFFFRNLPLRFLAAGGEPLQQRAGTRVNVSAQFALEYGWVMVMLLPLLLVVAARWARARRDRFRRLPLLAAALPVVAGVTIIFAKSRSAEVAMGVAIVLVVLLSGANRILTRAAVLAAIGALVLLAVHPAFFTEAFRAGASDPLSVRLNRIPILFGSTTGRPFTGIGLSSQLFGADNGYVVLFVTVGMVGVLAWAVASTTAVVSSTRGLRAPRHSDERLLAAACVVGLVGAAVACALYDLTNTVESRWTWVVLAALGTAVAETVPRRAVRRRWSLRLVLPAIGLAVGGVILAATPASATQSEYLMTTVPFVSTEFGGPTSPYLDRVNDNTACSIITLTRNVVAGTSVNCYPAVEFAPAAYPAEISVTVRGRTPALVRQEIDVVQATASPYVFLAGGPTSEVRSGKPALAVTAPLTGAVIGLGIALIVPALYRRRSPAGATEPVGVALTG